MSQDMPRPFLKWAGGKGQLLEDIGDNMPIEFTRYFEPFLGGGAVFFYLHRKGFSNEAILNDVNAELVTAYKTVRDHVEELIEELESGGYEPEKKTFYKIRAWDREPEWEGTDPIKKTARMVYLNRTCYNGLYRVNQKGQFNVPFGRYENPTICDRENLRAVSDALANTEILCTDFEEALRNAGEGDFVYLDPPYQPVSETANFTSYTAGGFDAEEQKRLAQVFRDLDARRCYVLESNSATQFIRDLYVSDFTLEAVNARRAISSDPDTRGEIMELLIRNYEETRQQKLA